MPNRNPVCSGNSDSQRTGVDTTIASICFCSLGTSSIRNLGEGLPASFKWSLENLPPPHTISLSCITQMCLLLVRHSPGKGGKKGGFSLLDAQMEKPDCVLVYLAQGHSSGQWMRWRLKGNWGPLWAHTYHF